MLAVKQHRCMPSWACTADHAMVGSDPRHQVCGPNGACDTESTERCVDEMSFTEFGDALKAGELAEVIVIRPEEGLNSSSLLDEAVLEDTKKTLNARSGAEMLKNQSNPFYPGSIKTSSLRNQPLGFLPIEAFAMRSIWFRESSTVSQDSGPCQGSSVTSLPRSSVSSTWRVWCVRASQTPIPRKDVLQNNMVGCTLYSALDLVDGYYPLLMQASDITLTAVSTPSDMLWEWRMMPQSQSNAPATFNRLVTRFFRHHRAYAQTYFDDIFVHSRAEHGKTDVENQVEYLRVVLECMRTNKLNANVEKRIFGAEGIPCLYKFDVKYKPGKQNALADALSRRPDYELAHVTMVTSSIPDLIRASYASDDMCVALLKALGSKEFEASDIELSARLRARLHRYAFISRQLYYSTGSDDTPWVVVPHDEDLKYRIFYEAHDTPVGGHLGREKTYSSVRYLTCNKYS
ncbi:unnamed protein product [Phytophthora fragariaefolia]|uniref:Unnamed protein product n=1 Tax=Phytophthora fragariaefolia TaxID=1490495 RepID=A0A9W6YNM8_9STRA|nr:unnamed protein product [Phytophthora fragariaefolia]